NPFKFQNLQFEVKHDGSKLYHREWCQDAKGNLVAELNVEINYVMGSGTQGRTYLFERDGFLFESPISWYPRKKAPEGTAPGWDVSPGYAKGMLHFNRKILPRCLYCHCNDAKPLEHTTHQYETPVFQQHAIGCERCHGPGSLHVASRKKGIVPENEDYTIVN